MVELNPNLLRWGTSKKTKPIRAKPLSALIVDKSVTAKFVLSTLEGNQEIKEGSVVCIGPANDAWQQLPNKLFGQYTVTGLDRDGWMECAPKPEAVVDCAPITELIIGSEKEFFIYALWGKPVGDGRFTQDGIVGDYVCRNQTDHADVWIVARKVFENTRVYMPPI